MNSSNYVFKLPKKTSRSLFKRVAIPLLVLAIVVGGGSYVYFEHIRSQQPSTTTTSTQGVTTSTPAATAPVRKPVIIAIPGASKEFTAPIEDYSQPEAIWKYVNKDNFLPEYYAPTNLTVPRVASVEGHLVRKELLQPLDDMFEAASKEGLSLMVGSAYRSYKQQQTIYNGYVATNGQAYADRYSAVPGSSEHQLGLAVDISREDRRCFLDETCFITTAEGQWLDANAYKYGFIVRYPKGKEDVTGYSYESWHFRYVGTDLATALHETGLTFDEVQPQLTTALKQLRERKFIE